LSKVTGVCVLSVTDSELTTSFISDGREAPDRPNLIHSITHTLTWGPDADESFTRI